MKLDQISAGHWWSCKFFFAKFQILGPLGCQGWVVIPQNVKKSKSLHLSVYIYQLSAKCCTVSVRHRLGPEWDAWGNPQEWNCSYRWLSHLGVRAPYATPRKRRYEANQVWLNTTFILQGSQSWGKLAVETWRVKTELIIITILHIIFITTSILNLGFKTIAPKILAHTKMHK